MGSMHRLVAPSLAVVAMVLLAAGCRGGDPPDGRDASPSRAVTMTRVHESVSAVCKHFASRDAARILGAQAKRGRVHARGATCAYEAGESFAVILGPTRRGGSASDYAALRAGTVKMPAPAFRVIRTLRIAAYWEQASNRRNVGVLLSYPVGRELWVTAPNTRKGRARAVAATRAVLAQLPR